MTAAASVNQAVLYDARQRAWLSFTEPLHLYVSNDMASVQPVLDAVSAAVAKHRYAVGFVAYEAAPAFDPALAVKPDAGFPLAWFAIYDRAREMDFPELDRARLGDLVWQLSVNDDEYYAALQHIKDYIHEGSTYQVNYTYRMRTPYPGDPWDLFVHMIHAQGHGYGAYINTADWCICSASHELFFSCDAGRLLSRPMKGTVRRGLTAAGDQDQSAWLRQSPKNRAENLMIVDMVRNDLGRIAETGSVRTTSLFDVEKYPTLWQMTSTVQATTSADVGGIFRALFPPASITGAPKARTMEIIRELETEPRRIYTGSIGLVRPDHSAQFNVAIRTVLVDKHRRIAEYGVGGGIVWDSETGNELDECKLKARVLTYVEEQFDLLETMLWTPEDGYVLLPLHLERLSASAEYFSRRLDLEQVRGKLAAAAARFAQCPQRIRLRLSESGAITLESDAVKPLPQPYRVRLAGQPLDWEHDPFLHHKTTRRQVYERILAAHPGCDDVLLLNMNDEVTESCIANVVVELQGELVTPPVSCGLLPGTYRRHLLEQGKIREQAIKSQQVRSASRIFLINSVRGMWQAELVAPPAEQPG